MGFHSNTNLIQPVYIHMDAGVPGVQSCQGEQFIAWQPRIIFSENGCQVFKNLAAMVANFLSKPRGEQYSLDCKRLAAITIIGQDF